MSDLLPNSWATAQIGTITIDTEQKVPSSDEQVVYIDISSVDRNTKLIASPQHLLGKEAPSRARKVVQTGDVLVSMTRPNLNAVALVTEELDGRIASTGFDVLRTDGIDPRWLFYVVRTTAFIQEMSDLVQGALYPAVRSKDVRAYEMPIAPINEQKRITDKLDFLVARVDTCRERLNRVPFILERFRQAVLAAAYSGQLIEDWREENGFFDLKVETLGEVIVELKTGPFGSALHKTDYIEGGVPIINPMHINAGRITSSAMMTVSPTKAEELKEFRLQVGDVVIARRGVMGRCAVVTEKEKGWLCGTGSMLLRPSDTIDANYLQICLSSPEVTRTLEADAVGSTMVNLNQKILLGIELRVPSVQEQRITVSRVKPLFAFADRLESRLATARKHVEQLTPAILAKAFRGELVPQDPYDEPASVLLERIRATRSAAEPNAARKRHKKIGKSKKSLRKEVLMLTRKDIQPTHLCTILRQRGPLIAEELWATSQLDIDDFYDQLKEEEGQGLLKERRGGSSEEPLLLEAIV